MASPKTHTSAAFCPGCGERVLRAATDRGPEDLTQQPSQQGAWWAYQEVTGWQARRRSGPALHPLEKPYESHICPPEET